MKMDAEEIQETFRRIGQLSNEGSKHHEENDLQNAVRCYKKAYKLAREINDDKIERTCALNLGAACIAIGKATEGMEYLHKATPPDEQRDERSNGDLYFNMGLGHEKLNQEVKALNDFNRAYEEYSKYERDRMDVQIQCLEKCFQIYQGWKDYVNAAEVCKKIAECCDDNLSRADRLCERAAQLRMVNREEAKGAAEESKNLINDTECHGEDCMVAAKILNDLGLVFTQLQQYDEATTCFEKAVEFVKTSHKIHPQLEAVVLQNLGAAYNFCSDFQRAIKCHEDAAMRYAKINYRNGQGQCFTNLAFALSQLGQMKDAEVAFHHALQASKDTGDSHMRWQALEGLGAVSYNQGHGKEAVDFFSEALRYVGENITASERIKSKLFRAIESQQTGYGGSPFWGQGQPAYQRGLSGGTTLLGNSRNYMATHGPLEEHAQLRPSPRMPTVNESQVEAQIIQRKSIPLAGQQPAMSSVQETKPRRKMMVRKAGSMGFHKPKIARGLDTGTPRATQEIMQRTSVLSSGDDDDDDDDESTDDSEEDSEEEEDSSGMDNPDRGSPGMTISAEKMDTIFNRSSTSAGVDLKKNQKVRMNPNVADDMKHLSMYEQQLRAREEKEESEEDSSEEDSEDDSDDDDDDSDDSDDDNDEHQGRRARTSPPLPTQSPPSTAQLNNGTYLTPESNKIRTVAEVHQSQSISKSRPAPQQEHADADDNDENDGDKSPYATIDTATKLHQKQQAKGQGNDNDTVTKQQQRSGSGEGHLKSQNFFDSDGSVDQSMLGDKKQDGEGSEGPYHSLKFESENGAEEEGGRVAMKNMPRGQREMLLAQYHKEHEGQDPPELPPREEKQSKTCIIM